jgi:hypothetical protein
LADQKYRRLGSQPSRYAAREMTFAAFPGKAKRILNEFAECQLAARSSHVSPTTLCAGTPVNKRKLS